MNVPLNISVDDIDLSKPCVTKTLIPTGGVIAPKLVTITRTVANQIGSYPNATTVGKKIGIISREVG